MCTSIRFTDDRGNMYAGRNLDWECGYGEHPLIVPERYERQYTYIPHAQGEHGAIVGIGIVAEGLPLYFDCGNEDGLYIAGLNFPGYADYENPDKAPIPDKINVAAYEFPLWVVSNFATVDEVRAELSDVAIVAKQPTPQFPVSLLHWIISDADCSIVVEYMEDGIHIFDNDLDSLTNQPTYSYHRENVRSYMNLTPEVPSDVNWSADVLSPYGSGGGMRGLPGDYYSPSRFVRVAYFNAMYPQQEGESANVNRMFKTLGTVSMIKGGAKMSDGNYEYTVYTDCFSSATKTIYFTTYEDSTLRSVSLADVAVEKLSGNELILLDSIK